jgi:hypothetical protein
MCWVHGVGIGRQKNKDTDHVTLEFRPVLDSRQSAMSTIVCFELNVIKLPSKGKSEAGSRQEPFCLHAMASAMTAGREFPLIGRN